jgi:hypothetical protein
MIMVGLVQTLARFSSGLRSSPMPPVSSAAFMAGVRVWAVPGFCGGTQAHVRLWMLDESSLKYESRR